MLSLQQISCPCSKNAKHVSIKRPKNIVQIQYHKQYMRQKIKQTKLMLNKSNTHTTKASLESDLLMTQLYSLSHTQVFLFSALRNLVTFHMPCLFIYTQLCSFPYMLSASLVLYLSILKTIIQLAIYLS